MPRSISKLTNQFLDVWQLTFTDFDIFTSQRTISTISSRVVEHVSVPGTVSGRLRSSALHVRSVRKDGMIRQRLLRDGVFEGARYVNFLHCES